MAVVAAATAAKEQRERNAALEADSQRPIPTPRTSALGKGGVRIPSRSGAGSPPGGSAVVPTSPRGEPKSPMHPVASVASSIPRPRGAARLVSDRDELKGRGGQTGSCSAPIGRRTARLERDADEVRPLSVVPSREDHSLVSGTSRVVTPSVRPPETLSEVGTPGTCSPASLDAAIFQPSSIPRMPLQRPQAGVTLAARARAAEGERSVRLTKTRGRISGEKVGEPLQSEGSLAARTVASPSSGQRFDTGSTAVESAEVHIFGGTETEVCERPFSSPRQPSHRQSRVTKDSALGETSASSGHRKASSRATPKTATSKACSSTDVPSLASSAHVEVITTSASSASTSNWIHSWDPLIEDVMLDSDEEANMLHIRSEAGDVRSPARARTNRAVLSSGSELQRYFTDVPSNTASSSVCLATGAGTRSFSTGSLRTEPPSSLSDDSLGLRGLISRSASSSCNPLPQLRGVSVKPPLEVGSPKQHGASRAARGTDKDAPQALDDDVLNSAFANLDALVLDTPRSVPDPVREQLNDRVDWQAMSAASVRPPAQFARTLAEPSSTEVSPEMGTDCSPVLRFASCSTNVGQASPMSPKTATLGEGEARSDAQAPYRMCQIVGSWDDFKGMHEMAWDRGGYKYVVRVGRRGEESFQIVVDGSPSRRIYPSVPGASSRTTHVLRGPDSGGRGLNWTIGAADKAAEGSIYDVVMSCPHGFPQRVFWTKLNPVLSDTVSSDIEAVSASVADNGVPPVNSAWGEAESNPIALHVDEVSPTTERGSIRTRIEFPSVSVATLTTPIPEVGNHPPYRRCHVAGSWDEFKSMNEMCWDGSSYKCVVKMEHDQESFQIVVEGTWARRIYPSVADATQFMAHCLRGPDSGGYGANWVIGKDPRDAGEPGASYEVELSCPRGLPVSVKWTRLNQDIHTADATSASLSEECAASTAPPATVFDFKVAAGGSSISLPWQAHHPSDLPVPLSIGEISSKQGAGNFHAESGTSTSPQFGSVDPVSPTVGGHTAVRPYRQCHVIGTWDDFRELHEMTWEDGAYRYRVTLGERAEESFQIVVDGVRIRQIYPSIADASPHVPHFLRGPDNGGSGVFWTVGRNEPDAAECGAAYDVVMSCPRGLPVSVRWTKVGASSGFVAAGGTNDTHGLPKIGDGVHGAGVESTVQDGTVTTEVGPGMDGTCRSSSVGPYRKCQVVGQWDDFQGPLEMMWDGVVYRCRIPLGGRTEASFQIIVDGSTDRRIYPSVQNANPYMAHRLEGPDSGGQGAYWTIGRDKRDGVEEGSVYEVAMSCPRGLPLSVRWARERAAGNDLFSDAAMVTTSDKDVVVEPPTTDSVAAIGVGSRGAASWKVAASADSVSLHVEPANSESGSQDDARGGVVPPYRKCHIVGSWDDFSGKSKMNWCGCDYRYVVQLGAAAKASFQIVVDGVWERRIYPSVPDANPYTLHHLKGPDGAYEGMRWTVGADERDGGEPGSSYEVSLSCPRGLPESVRWSKLGADGCAVSTAVDEDNLDLLRAGPKDQVSGEACETLEEGDSKLPYRKCEIVGSWDNFQGTDMVWDSGVYRCRVQLGETGRGTFHIVVDGSRECRIYPSVENATCFVHHWLRGPDCHGHETHWSIGHDDRDGAEPGAVFEVAMSCPRGLPVSVRWTKASSTGPPAVLPGVAGTCQSESGLVHDKRRGCVS